MAYITGVADNHVDLWDKLITFLTDDPQLVASGENWFIDWSAPSGAPNESDIVLRGVGSTGKEEILVGLSRFENYEANSFYFRMVGMTGINPTATAYDDHINTSKSVVMYADQNAMRYWFVANGRRFVVVVKISTVYQSMYGGFFLPYSDPLSYRYPLMIGGSAGPNFDSNENWTSTQSGHSHFPMPYGSSGNFPSDQPSLYMCDPGAQWLGVDNGSLTSTANVGCAVAPWKWGGGMGVTFITNHTDSPVNMLSNMRECLGGGFPLQPATLIQVQPADQTWGTMDGVFHVPGFNNAAENIIEIGGVEHLVVQNVYRTSPLSYWALALE